jgi:LPXTG-motif cell wall-anchored protein
MYGGGLGGGTVPGVAGATTIAALPNTGGSGNVVMYMAIASIVLGVAVLASTAARFVAKRYVA